QSRAERARTIPNQCRWGNPPVPAAAWPSPGRTPAPAGPSIPAQGVTDFRADPVAPGDAETLGLLARQELPVDGQAGGLAHALVVERAVGLVVAWEYQPPGGGEVAVPAQLGVGHDAAQQLAR